MMKSPLFLVPPSALNAMERPSGDHAGAPIAGAPVYSTTPLEADAFGSAAQTSLNLSNRILVPSGDHAGRKPLLPISPPEASAWTLEPSAFTTYSANRISNAIRSPSGDQAGTE